ncbi:serine/threonine-protein kinase [Longimicrobium terrae]|uniref:Serine/threonine protein kinase n=1 Tax=Longimicrobium terrae TaxID=1639882 RepID=A0A841H4C0_9BACT|nr:serine/threonine-protein kinase [Longimicrobium terrae]MBB4638293.1 serine/threonine protein kinase [Longimicrobium terrae]MBB6072639.1 serine/threonine protein kinase [Longimicrobium terrae]NNC28582.1 serine/threonine protein kinase [Longimicrobium terrae]
MASPSVARARYQGLAAARRWEHEPARPREKFTLSVGDRVGELTVIGHVARGRIAELYQVWSNRHWCALTGKLVLPEYCVKGQAPVSFRREAEVLEKLKHPNIVRLFGSGEADGRPFILLEYLAGPSLFDVLEGLPNRRLHVPDAIRAIMHVGAAIHYLHRCGYIYRDMKPANVHLREGVPVLLDFDVVRELEPLRRPADRLGTAPYMAPEQVRREVLTTATDVYGLGALLYELVTGKWPHEEPVDAADEAFWDELDEDDSDEPEPVIKERTAVVDHEMTTRELEQRYPQLCQPIVPPRAHTPGLPRAFEAAVLRALDPDPSARYQTVSGLLAALAPMLKGKNRMWPENAPVERRADTATR